jgi:hypothetical protein
LGNRQVFVAWPDALKCLTSGNGHEFQQISAEIWGLMNVDGEDEESEWNESISGIVLSKYG